MPTPKTVIRHSKHGSIELQIDSGGGNVQVNCMMPPRGPGFFVVFPAGEDKLLIKHGKFYLHRYPR